MRWINHQIISLGSAMTDYYTNDNTVNPGKIDKKNLQFVQFRIEAGIVQ